MLSVFIVCKFFKFLGVFDFFSFFVAVKNVSFSKSSSDEENKFKLFLFTFRDFFMLFKLLLSFI